MRMNVMCVKILQSFGMSTVKMGNVCIKSLCTAYFARIISLSEYAKVYEKLC